MKTMRLDINKKIAKSKSRITAIEVFQGTLVTEVHLYEYNTKLASMLLADAPDWLRNVVRINQHNLTEAGAK